MVQIEGVANKEEAQFYLGKVGFNLVREDLRRQEFEIGRSFVGACRRMEVEAEGGA